MYVCITGVSLVPGVSHERVIDPLELEIQMVVSNLGTEPSFSAIASSDPNYWSISPAASPNVCSLIIFQKIIKIFRKLTFCVLFLVFMY